MKSIVVTGAAGGMGAAVCSLLAQSGYQVFGLDVAQANPIPGVTFVHADLASEASVQAACRQVAKAAGKIYAIVHMAGIYALDSLAEMPEADFLRVFNINLAGVYRINKAFVPHMERGSRIIITTSELAPLYPLPFTGIYAISKAALEKYAFSLRMELNLLGIFVSVVRPGAVSTGFLGASTTALDRFCGNTSLYSCNAQKFRQIVDSVEARAVLPHAIARVVLKGVNARRPHYAYCKNRNPLLLLLNVLPHRLQVFIIRQVLQA